MNGLKSIEIILDEVANVFEQASHTCMARSVKEHNKQLRRDEIIAANVWMRAAAHLRDLKITLVREWTAEKMKNEVIKYHNGDN